MTVCNRRGSPHAQSISCFIGSAAVCFKLSAAILHKTAQMFRCYMLVDYAFFFLCLFEATSCKVVICFLLNVLEVLEEIMSLSAVVVDFSNADKLISRSGFWAETV